MDHGSLTHCQQLKRVSQMGKPKGKSRADVERLITSQIIAALESGTGNWAKPWASLDGAPNNPKTGRDYRGVNRLVLSFTQHAAMYPRGIWAGYGQWKALGAQVMEGEKATYITVPIPIKRHDEEADEVTGMYFKPAHVFNVAQVHGYDMPEIADPRALQDYLEYANAKAFVSRTGAVIKHGGNKAFYVPSKDAIMLPAREAFSDGAAYYSTLFHELTHWTGHDKRLDRKQCGKFGSNDYAFEELVAEIGAAFLCSDMGVSNDEPRADHAQYLKHWLEILKASDKAIFSAASQAGKASEYLNELTAVRVAA
jgi:antirestriction protein ArdC